MTKIEEQLDVLTTQYNEIVSQRSKAIKKYDRSLDGSEEKKEAIREMDNLGAQLRNIEAQIDEVLIQDED